MTPKPSDYFTDVEFANRFSATPARRAAVERWTARAHLRTVPTGKRSAALLASAGVSVAEVLDALEPDLTAAANADWPVTVGDARELLSTEEAIAEALQRRAVVAAALDRVRPAGPVPPSPQERFAQALDEFFEDGS